jgi:hypothetical protein
LVRECHASDAKSKTITHFAIQNAVYFYRFVSVIVSYAKILVIISIRFSENLEGAQLHCNFCHANCTKGSSLWQLEVNRGGVSLAYEEGERQALTGRKVISRVAFW